MSENTSVMVAPSGELLSISEEWRFEWSDSGAMKGIAERLTKAVQATSKLERTGWNDYFKYKFVTAEDVKEAARTALSEAGIAVLPGMLGVIKEPHSNKEKLTRINWGYTLVCEEGWVRIPWQSEALDGQDKGNTKAATSGLKWFLIALLQIPTGDEVDPDGDKPVQQNESATGGNGREPVQETVDRPYAPDVLRRGLVSAASKMGRPDDEASTKGQIGLVAGKMREIFVEEGDGQDQAYYTTLLWLTGVDSANDLTFNQSRALLDWMIASQDDSGDYQLKPYAVQEANLVYRQALKEAGQIEMELEAENEGLRGGKD